jgi:hypothetical protein
MGLSPRSALITWQPCLSSTSVGMAASGGVPALASPGRSSDLEIMASPIINKPMMQRNPIAMIGPASQGRLTFRLACALSFAFSSSYIRWRSSGESSVGQQHQQYSAESLTVPRWIAAGPRLTVGLLLAACVQIATIDQPRFRWKRTTSN